MFSEYLIDFLPRAKSIVFFTGAGISAESGISTFRDPDGLWNKFSPMELASINGFMSNPQRVWEWYQFRRQTLNSAEPNAGHYAIANLQSVLPDVSVITQNVDRLHQKAGAKNVIELHGNIITNRCFKCSQPYEDEINLDDNIIPKCNHCEGNIRPDVVWFGEMLPQDELIKAQEKSEICDIIFSIGTSGEVYPAAELPVLAKEAGAYFVEINTAKTALSDFADECLLGKSGEILPKLLKEIGL
jgi:NAD-dependent deacetylase